MMIGRHHLALLLTVQLCGSNNPDNGSQLDYQNTTTNYGLDISFPVHGHVSQNYGYLPHNLDPKIPVPAAYEGKPIQPLGDRHHMYLEHLDGCRKAYAPDKSHWCDTYEYDRLLMNKRQPQSMVNLTETGFKKVRAPEHLIELVTRFWDKHNHQRKTEQWGDGNSYLNHWMNPTEMVSVDDTGLRGYGGTQLKREIWAALSALMEEWTQQELQPSSLYGIRIYHEGAIMMPHVDRLPLVVSAIVNVAQDVDEDWPTEIYDHEGHAHNITLQPGEMLFFESASCIHGHPFPLKGVYYASIFVHFEPTGKSLGMDDDGYYFLKGTSDFERDGSARKEKVVDEMYQENTKNGHGGQSSHFDGALPPYIQRASPEEKHWLEQHPVGWKTPAVILPPDAHIAAKKGELFDLELELEERGEEILTERDEHGWQVLHQGVLGGNTEVVELLISKGADINSRTHGGYGETPLRIAERWHGMNSTLVQYLRRMGGLSIGPEL